MNMNEIHIKFRAHMEEELDVPQEMEKDLDKPLPAPQDSPESNLKRALRVIEAEGYDYRSLKIILEFWMISVWRQCKN